MRRLLLLPLLAMPLLVPSGPTLAQPGPIQVQQVCPAPRRRAVSACCT